MATQVSPWRSGWSGLENGSEAVMLSQGGGSQGET